MGSGTVWCFRNFLVAALIYVFFSKSFSQENPLRSKVRIQFDSVEKSIHLSYSSPQKMRSMLVHLTNESSNTIYLENIYQFQVYDKKIELGSFRKGRYTLTIKNDEGKFSETFNIK